MMMHIRTATLGVEPFIPHSRCRAPAHVPYIYFIRGIGILTASSPFVTISVPKECPPNKPAATIYPQLPRITL